MLLVSNSICKVDLHTYVLSCSKWLKYVRKVHLRKTSVSWNQVTEILIIKNLDLSHRLAYHILYLQAFVWVQKCWLVDAAGTTWNADRCLAQRSLQTSAASSCQPLLFRFSNFAGAPYISLGTASLLSFFIKDDKIKHEYVFFFNMNWS